MKIESYGGPKVESRGFGTPEAGVDARGAGGAAIAAGLEQLDQGLSQLGHAQRVHQAKLDQAMLQADNTAATNAAAQLQGRLNDRIHGNEQQAATQQQIDAAANWNGPATSPGLDLSDPENPKPLAPEMPAPSDATGGVTAGGFLSTRGEGAAAQSVPTLNGIDGDYQALRDGLQNKRQQQMFDAHAHGMRLSARRQVEDHTTQQIQVAHEASLQARAGTALTAVANDYSSEDTAAEQSASVEQSIRGLQLSQEDGDHRIAEFRSQVDQVRLQQFLSNKDWKGAQALLAVKKEELGPKSAPFEKAIAEVKQDAEGDTIASKAVELARDTNGKVDGGYALEQVDALTKGNVALRDEARRRTQQRITQDDQAFDQQTKNISDAAFGAYNTGGWAGIPGPLKQQLNQRNPSLYFRLQNETELRYRRSQGTKSDALRLQREANQQALNDYKSLSDEEIVANEPEEFVAGRGVNGVGLSALGPVQKAAQNRITNGTSVKLDEFRRDAQGAAAGVVSGKNDLKQYLGEATNAWEDFEREHKRPPTRDEAREAIGKLLSDRVTPGYLWDSKTPEYKARGSDRKKGIAAPPATSGDAELLTAPPATVDIVGPDGVVQRGPAKGIDAWLAKHPQYRRK